MDKAINRVTKRLLPRVLALLVSLTASGSGLAQSPQVEVLEETAEYRVVKHAAGETKVPAEPQRVAVLYANHIDPVVALGIVPHAAAFKVGVLEDNPHVADRLENTLPLGTQDAVNLEALLAAQPDLILSTFWMENIYTQLSAIAPTVLTPRNDTSAAARFMDVARVFGREAEAQEILGSYQAQAQTLKAELAASGVGDDTYLHLFVTDRAYAVFQPDLFFAGILHEELGLHYPEGLYPLNDYRADLSAERLLQLNPDHIFAGLASAEAGEALTAQLRTDPALRNLTAVERDQIYVLPNYLIEDTPLGNLEALTFVRESLLKPVATGEGE